MEEKVKEASGSDKLTYEQLEQAAMQLQQRLIMVENKLRSIDFASMRLTWLFKVIENKDSFSMEFLNKCSDEIKTLLTIEEENTEAPDSADAEA